MLVKRSVYEPCENIFNYAINNKRINSTVSIEVQAVIAAFFNALMEKIKDINLLTNSGRNESIELISRTYFEQYVYAMYILKSDTERKSKAFLNGFWISELRKYKKTIGHMEENKRYQLNGASFEKFIECLDVLSTIQVPEVSSFDELIEFYEKEYLKLLINKGKKINFKNFKWYNLDGKINSMRDLVKNIGLKDSEYEIAYALPSTPLHGTDVVRKVTVRRKDKELIYKNAIDSKSLKSIEALLVLCLKNLTLEIAKFYGVNNDNHVHSEIARMRINYKGIYI